MVITPVTIPTTSIFPIVLLMLQAQLVPYRFRFLLGLWTKLLVLSALSVSGVFAYDTITTVVLSWLLFSKKDIEHIVSVDSDTQFKTFANYFFCASEFGERDIRTIPFLEELYDEFPIRSLFDSLNAFCSHSLDGKDADITRPEDIVISASARRFLESRLENNDTVESSPSRSADEDNILTSDTSILDYNFNVNESNSNFDKTKTDSTGNTTATVTRSRTT